MAKLAIKVTDLWERFSIVEERARSLKEVASRFRVVRGRKDVWALKGIDLQVEQGETVGLIGANGSGKSTLLRCIAGILPPTKGEVLIGGTVSSLIELGAGFDPELTGRENAEVTSVLFGVPSKQLQKSFDDIVGFADLEGVIDRPVRSYSSGMYVRLAFSLAIFAQPNILLIDEVLAVGDESFQRKCIQKVAELGDEGTTIVFVSHDLHLVERICSRTIALHQGETIADGTTAETIEAYLRVQSLSPR